MTGISYGQLYRWKREKLIPEDWFIKQASITGQETFFPKEKVLLRVNRILEWKDKYSLEEMAAMLSPEFVDQLFSEEQLDQFQEIEVNVAALFMDIWDKDEFSFREILWMMVFSKYHREHKGEEAKLRDVLEHIAQALMKLPSLDYNFCFLEHNDTIYAVLQPSTHSLYLDDRMHVQMVISLQEMSQQMKEKYQAVFQSQHE